MLSDGGGARAAAEVAREGRRRREKNEEDRGVPIYKGVSEQAGAKIKETRIMIIQINGRLDSWKALKNERSIGR